MERDYFVAKVGDPADFARIAHPVVVVGLPGRERYDRGARGAGLADDLRDAVERSARSAALQGICWMRGASTFAAPRPRGARSAYCDVELSPESRLLVAERRCVPCAERSGGAQVAVQPGVAPEAGGGSVVVWSSSTATYNKERAGLRESRRNAAALGGTGAPPATSLADGLEAPRERLELGRVARRRRLRRKRRQQRVDGGRRRRRRAGPAAAAAARR